MTLIVIGGAASSLITLGHFTWAVSSGIVLAEAMTMTFATLVLIEFFKAYSFRSDRHSIAVRPFANKWLNLAVAWELLLVVLVAHVAEAFLESIGADAPAGFEFGHAVRIDPAPAPVGRGYDDRP